MFRYPDHPNTNRVDPFRDPDGRNPFADPEAGQSSVSENPYAVSAEAKPQDYQPEGYVANQRGRGRLLLTTGVAGFLATALAAGTILTASLISAMALGGVLMGVSAPLLLGGAACWAVWLMSRADLRAMRAGAMQPDDLAKTRWAHRLSVIGTLLTIAPVVLLIVALILAVLEDV
jgi:hypothetical protein